MTLRATRTLFCLLACLAAAACRPADAVQDDVPPHLATEHAAAEPTERADETATERVDETATERVDGAVAEGSAVTDDEAPVEPPHNEDAATAPTDDVPAPALAPDAARLGLTGAPPRNVVLLIGDGMGPVHETAGSHWVHGADRQLRMQQAPYQGSAATACADREITDSAAAATAMSTGVHVNYEVVAVALPGDGSPLPTVLEQFLDAGRPAGMVTTTRLSHATPASYAAHVPVRYAEELIVPQVLETQPTLIFGGGGRGMTASAAQEAGYTVATTAEELADLPDDAERWALVVGRSHVPYVADGRGTAPDLATMTTRALHLLDKPDGPGFFLLVEGGRIDHASHNNDIDRMLPEMDDFDDALGAVLEWADGREDTLVLLTADHECGGLSIDTPAGQGEIPEVSWSTGGHTAADVNVYGWGPFGDRVMHVRDNRDIYWLSRWPLGVSAEDMVGTPLASDEPTAN